MGSKTVAAAAPNSMGRTLIKALRLQLEASLLPGDAPVGKAELDEAATWLLAAAATRAPGQSLVQLESATGQRRHLRIAIINDDKPFLVDSVAAAIAVPVGIMAAIFLAELGPDSKLGNAARFAAKMLTGLPSILAGVFAYALVVMTTGTYSAPAGGVALAVLMLPIVVLTAEESMRMVPKIMKDAAYGMGCTRSQVIWKIVLPTGMPAILTGVMLAVARAAGETAPLLFTALFSNYWIYHDGDLAVMNPTASLAVLIYNFSGMPFDNQLELAWAASLVLVMIVLVVNIVSRIFGKPKY